MVQCHAWRVAIRFAPNAGGAWDSEMAQTGFGGRARGAELDQLGSLPPFDVQEGYEEETYSLWNIDWAHWSPGGGVTSYGLGQGSMKTIANAIDDWFTGIRTYISSSFSLREIRMYALGLDGKTPGGGSNKFVYLTPRNGSGSTPLPPNLSIVQTLQGPRRGRRGHGRMFIPYLAQGVLKGDGLINTTAQGALASATQKLVQDVNSANTLSAGATTDLTVATVSLGRREYADVVQIRVGDEFDVQNRRREQRREVYVTRQV